MLRLRQPQNLRRPWPLPKKGRHLAITSGGAAVASIPARQIMLIIIINRDRTTKALTRADTLEFGDASANNRETFFCGLIRMGDQAPKPISILYPDAEKCPVCLSRRPLPLLPVHQGNSLARDGLVPNQLDASNQPLSPVNRPGILAL
jgi:hypothetical protein